MKIARRHLLWGGVQAALAIVLLAWLIGRMENREELLLSLRHATQRPDWLLAAFGLSCGCILVSVWRWKLLLRRLVLPIPFGRALHLFLMGQFFNAFLPGASGGDLVRATAIAAGSPGRRTQAVASVVVDRLLGLMALGFLAAVVALLQWPHLQDSAATRLIGWAALVAAAGGVLLLGAVHGSRLPERLMVRLESRGAGRWWRSLLHAVQALHDIVRHPGTCIGALGLSVLNHLLVAGSIGCLARALGIVLGELTASPGMPRELVTYLLVGPLIQLVAAIPITPNALGTREAAAVALLGLPVYGVAAAEAVSLGLLLFALATLWSIISGLVYLGTRFRRHGAEGVRARVDGDPVLP